MHKLHNSIRKTVRTIDGTMSEGVTPAGPRQNNDRLLPSNLVLSVLYIYIELLVLFPLRMEWRKFYWREKFILDNF